jgi:diguanylate cyclase with GGDEF domain
VGAAEAIRELARPLDRRLLLVPRGEGAVWAWLGGRRALDPAELGPIAEGLPEQVSLAIGEPGEGIGGWCLSHRQAKAALPIALRSPEPFTRYADVALLASIMQDDLLATSLREIYLKPLAQERDGGRWRGRRCGPTLGRGGMCLRRRRHWGSTAIPRPIACARVEQAIGRPLDALAAELEAVLRLEEFDSTTWCYPAGC